MSARKLSKTTTVVLYAAVALCLIFVLAGVSHLPSAGRPHRRLKLFTDFPPDPVRFAVRFDPIVAEIEMRREDRAWERTHHVVGGKAAEEEWEGYGDAEDYINDEGRFNVSRRIEELFPRIDVDPLDGRVTLGELKAWFVDQATRDREHRTRRGMELYDGNKDGFVSLMEYQEKFRLFDDDDSNSSEIYSGSFSSERFHTFDVDGDGRLDLSEFSYFLHPEASTNPKIITWLCKEEIRDKDKDHDGKLNFEEFYPGLVDFLGAYDLNISDHSENSIKETGRELFARLDLDKDRHLNEKELEPVIGAFHPSEITSAAQQSKHAFKQADANKDGYLTLKEMIDHPYAFYMAVNAEELYDLPHEELR